MKKYLKYLPYGLFIITFFVFFYTVINRDNNISDDIKQNLPLNSQPSNKQLNLENVISLEECAIKEENSKNKIKTYNILMWTDRNTVPFVYLKQGGEIFVEEQCEYSNCYITNNQSYLSSITEFDALIFHAPEFTYKPFKRYKMPKERSPKQLYIFTCIESAHYYPVCSNEYNNFFNWTWTYRTSSEVKWGYVDIKDVNGSIVGPKPHMEWIQNMNNISEKSLNILKGKSKAVAWLVSNCHTHSNREKYAQQLGESLKKYKLDIDVYGKCGNLLCSSTEECHKLIKNDYYFYLSFENSLAEDYVTEKFLHAIKNYAIPIVLGGADYSRFAPPHSYLNAKLTNADDMAAIINDLMHNMSEYSSYFKWREHYTYQRDIDTPDTRASCRLCKALNQQGTITTHNNNYEDFKAWWNSGVPSNC